MYEVATITNSATFQINNVKLYVPFVTLSINDTLKEETFAAQLDRETFVFRGNKLSR